MEDKVLNVLHSLKRNNMNGYYIKNKAEIFQLIDQLIKDSSSVGCGDSDTLEKLGVFEYLRNRNIAFYDKHAEGLDRERKRELYLKNFTADVFISGSNAVTEQGEIINIDGNGSRVAPIIYGPPKVIIVIGTNKIAENAIKGMERVRQIAAPLDAKRLGKDTPCVKLGKCIDCKSKQRICNDFVTITGQFDPDRIHVIIVEGSWGY